MPTFNLDALKLAATPAPGYHIEASPFPGFEPDIPLHEPLTAGSTAPLSFNPKSPRKPRASDAARDREREREVPWKSGAESPGLVPRSMSREESGDGEEDLR
jgi:hypothetical protein